MLLTTYSDILANALKVKLRRLISEEPALAEQLEVASLKQTGYRLYKSHFGEPTLATDTEMQNIISEASTKVSGSKFGISFLVSEWNEVVAAWQLTTWEEYRDIKRLGRKTRLPEARRKLLWDIFRLVLDKLEVKGHLTEGQLFAKVASKLANLPNTPYNFIIVDEAQDLAPHHLKLLAAMGLRREEGLFFAGDLGQRIF